MSELLDEQASDLVAKIMLVSKNEVTLVVIRTLKAIAQRANDRFIETVDLLDIADTLARALVDETEKKVRP